MAELHSNPEVDNMESIASPVVDQDVATDNGEPDTCRICRTEAADSEMLFHPCKCSGSIKYVHQECLMEWLSHSQKKHCELCKTPFRFTKLYSSNMPEAVPLHLLARHVLVNTAKNIRTWLRFVLVVFVWLGCLPFTIRQVWGALFWFSDGKWPTTLSAPVPTTSEKAKQEIVELTRQMVLQEASRATATSPATPLLAVQETPAHLVSILGRMVRIFAQTNKTYGVTGHDSIENGAMKFISSFASDQASAAVINTNTSSSSSTLLSEVAFLRHLTRYEFVNNAVIRVAEGYVITFIVVVCFILIFLIREWVVQQQPGINMGAGFNADFAPVNRPREQQLQAGLQDGNNVPNVRIARRHGQDRPRRRHRQRRHGQEARGGVEGQGNLPADELVNRPPAVRDALSPAAEIQRMLAEEPPRLTEDFVAIWRRAKGDPQEVLRILESEDRDGQMQYWVNLQRRRLQSPYSTSSMPVTPYAGSSGVAQDAASPFAYEFDSEQPTNGDDVPDNWYDIPDGGDDDESDTLSESEVSHREAGHDDKGKSRALEEHHNPSLPTIFSSSSGTRPRAISDGPHRSFSKASLGHGTWTFNNLPDPAQSMELKLPKERAGKTADAEYRVPESSPYAVQETNESTVSSQALEGSQNEHSLPWTDVAMDGADASYRAEDELFYDQEDNTSTQEDAHSTSPHRADEPEESDDSDVGGSVAGTDTSTHVLPDGEMPRLDGRAPNPAPMQPRGLFGHVTDFFWGGVGGDALLPTQEVNDEHIVQDVAAEAPFVPVVHEDAAVIEEDLGVAEPPANAADVAAAFEINVDDLDALDDAEDFDGILDLIGMRGPIFSLVQNAIFSGFLLSLTVAFGIWIPYNIGKLSILLVANPGPTFKLPLRFMFSFAAFIQDLAMSIMGSFIYAGINLASIPLHLLSFISTSAAANAASVAGGIADFMINASTTASERVANGTLDALISFGESDIFAFSSASHESLLRLKIAVSLCLGSMRTIANAIAKESSDTVMAYIAQTCSAGLHSLYHSLITLPSILLKPETWVISLEISKREIPLDLVESVWSGTDRFCAVVTGYLTVCLLGALYVQKGSPFSTNQVGREWEATVIDLLNQAGGVFKVILIISIEMLAFPLYCGLLLDVALLPLFEGATISSRLLFTVRSPLTSIFVHWFVGTCYMFHFALFVSMCRKIMRKGVLYFIRDPDDPTFHPVRDVLERNVITQLRKILFSALVYGALVIVCLGGVVWGLAFSLNNVLPIHWSSNEAVFEFPIDLLFYNFLMPLAVKLFKPSDALHAMYTWWFRKCAHLLRLTWFMFDERRKDEEGYYRHWKWSRLFASQDVASKDGQGTDTNEKSAPDPFTDTDFQRDGRYVRAPASDQVRIPKGDKIFMTVDENNKRIDHELDRPDGIHGSENTQYKHLYIPPWFRLRIFSFILSIWVFAAVTGVSVTIIPLILGRYVFARFIPPHVRKNDIYAFSIGVYILGSILYAAFHVRNFYQTMKSGMFSAAAKPRLALRRLLPVLSRITRVLWTYTAFLVVLPILFSTVVELYLILPLHSYMALQERHVIHFVQNWTLGLLYVKLTTRFILWHAESRQAISLRAITRNGYLNPDAILATRCFILPLGLVLTTALIVPYGLATSFLSTIFKHRPDGHVLVYRYTYPLTMCAVVVGFALYSLWGMVKQWQLAIRDEVYLIGERLHNYGERKSSQAGLQGGPNMRRVETGA